MFNKTQALQDEIKIQKLMAQDRNEASMPLIEADRDVILYYNKGLMEHVDKVGYFIMDGVVVCETGKLESVRSLIAEGSKDYNQV